MRQSVRVEIPMKPFLAIFLLITLCACGADAPETAASSDSAGVAELARTAEAHRDDSPVPSPAATADTDRDVVGTRIAYGERDGGNLYGYLSLPADATGPVPGLLVIHEWWGLNDNIRAMTDRLAAEGYAALAVDLYDGGVAAQPSEAIEYMRVLMENSGAAEDNLRQAHDYLVGAVGSPSTGVIGWCLGGRWSLKAALLLPDEIDATVIYYGTVTADEAELSTLEMPILGIFASEDTVVPADTVVAFQDALERLGKQADVRIYDGVDHAFANPSGTAYDKPAADDAWTRTTAFLSENLR
jgi:carboxymethylenebutenolidase